MTACVEGKQKEKMEGGALSNKVIRAVLAAVLAIGLMPAIAFAEEPTSTEDQGIMPMASNDEAFLANKVTYNRTPDAGGNYIVEHTGAAANFIVQDVTNVNGVSLAAGTDYDVAYFTAKDGTKTTVATGAAEDGAAPVNQGTYYIGTYPHGATPTANNAIYQAFVVKSASLDRAIIYQINGDDLNDVSDTTFTYTGSVFHVISGNATANDVGKLWIAMDGKPMEGQSADVELNTDFNNITVPGNYTLKAVGKGAYAGQTRYFDITVEKFDLSKATVVIPDATGYGDSGAILNAAKISHNRDTLSADVVKRLNLKTTDFVGTASGVPARFETKGTYTVSLTPSESDRANYVNTASGSFTIAGGVVQQTDYAGTALVANGNRSTEGTATKPLLISASETFALSKIVVAKTQGDASSKLVLNKDYTVAVTKDGSAVTNYSDPGLYKAVITVKPGTDYALSGTCAFFFQVTKGAIAANGVFVSVDNTNVVGDDTTNAVANYTGKVHPVTVVVKDMEGNELVPGTDYAVAITDAKGNVVTDLVDAGNYTLKITSNTYNIPTAIKTGIFNFKVGSIKYTGIRVAGVVTIDKESAPAEAGLPYTGSEIVPTYQYTTDDLTKLAGGIADKKVTWTTLPAEAYTAAYKGPLINRKIIDAAGYTVSLAKNVSETTNTVVAANFDVTGAPQVWGGGATGTADNKFNVINAQVFADVPVTSWFAQPVASAKANAYISGYFGTKLFGPNDMITRADAVCVIFNMAGGTVGNEGTSNENIAYASKFTDVDAKAYYAQALGWAAKSGIVNGYSDNTFAPNAQITREAFAAILANFAKAKGDDMKVDTAAVLAKFSDGDQVSDWAKNVVAWTADKKIMGNGGTLSPAATITRAEVAAMAVNYQPTKLG